MIKPVMFSIFVIVIIIITISYCTGQFEDDQIDLNDAWFTEDMYNDPYFDKLRKKKKYGIIAPGTKWCGQGDKAESYNDLGKFNNTDICCRAHDNCPIAIKVGETLYGLKNPDLSTRLSCTCDREFHTCLKNVESLASKTIGTIYFDLLKKKCLDYKDGQYQWAESVVYSEARFILFIRRLLN
ncbi:phospholipase A2-like [Microplitis mediator]|uniref:phospholipase A2-like n=1 Tax=Microplitis mediator TaxID=375433 RepID=UPI0025523321|nr:phospholipase A2-like [Microplitis mediator]